MRRCLFLVSLLMAALFGCEQSTEPQPSDIHESVHRFLARDNRCFALRLAFPHTEQTAYLWSSLDPLNELGLTMVRDQNVPLVETRHSHQEGRLTRAKVYELSELGRRLIRAADGGWNGGAGSELCFGRKALKEITKVEEPRLLIDGRKTIDVEFSYLFVPEEALNGREKTLRDFYTHSAFVPHERSFGGRQDDGDPASLGSESKDKITFFLTTSGWKLENEIKNKAEMVIDESRAETRRSVESSHGVGAYLQKLLFGF